MRTREKGLTLIELMVTLAVAAVLLAVGIPAFDRMIANNRAAALANGLTSAFSLARTEALSRGLPVSVCPKNSADQAGKPPSTTCGTGANWPNGWLVFTDAQGVGVFEPSNPNNEVLIRAFSTPSQPPAITTTAALVRFGSAGMQQYGPGTTPTEVNMLLAQATATSGNSRCMTITAVGQVRVERKATCP